MSDLKIPVYISLTSVFERQHILLETLKWLSKQTKQPDKIFLYLSEEPYILDTGFKKKKITDADLLNFIKNNSIINIKWVKNIGPYRKLLPLLKEKWKEDCIIITIDDDLKMNKNSIKNLIDDYTKYKCVINYRGFTPMFNKIENFDYHKRASTSNTRPLYNFSTNGAGTLWKPEFFYKTKNLIFNDKIYLNTCDKQDDIWFYLVRILNNIECHIENKGYGSLDKRSNGLWGNFNRKDNANTKAFKRTLEKLKELGYKF